MRKGARMVNWNAFLSDIQRKPKNFAKAIVDHLNPPKYVLERIKQFEWICHFCWKPSIDICNWCQRSVCEEHGKKFIGEKTKLEWYICPDDLKTHTTAEIMKKISEEDEQFFQEDLTESLRP